MVKIKPLLCAWVGEEGGAMMLQKAKITYRYENV